VSFDLAARFFSQKDNGKSQVTINRYDFIVCTNDPDRPRMAARLDETITGQESLYGKLIRVVRPV
jgi:hypothetical protein